MELFRQEAVDNQRNRLQGDVVVLPRLSHGLLCTALVLWLLAVAVFLTQANYSRKESVKGWLEPEAGVVRVYPGGEGELARLMVRENDTVVSGQPLAIINGDKALPDGKHLEALLLEEYALQRSALERQLQRAVALRRQRESDLSLRIASAERELRWMDMQLASFADRQKLDARRLERHRRLQRGGHITDAELERLETEELQGRQEGLAHSLERERRLSLLGRLRAELALVPDETANSADQLRLRLSVLSQEMARLRGNRAYVIKAPLDGAVSDIQGRVGQQVRPDRALMSLMPEGSELVATLLVPVRAAGFLREGQPLLLRYDAFPYQKFGTHAGRLVSVSRTSALPGEHASFPFAIREPIYRAMASVEHKWVEAYGQAFALKSGMTLSADIRLEDRTILQWLLEPLYSLRGRLQ